jgi:dsRNA-specific ribonuclease
MNTREERDLAWIGDAVLALYAREWLLKQADHPLFSRQERFIRLTSNDFLKALGEPTKVEARIGTVYRVDGLEAAFRYIEQHLQPLFQRHLANATKGQRGKKR